MGCNDYNLHLDSSSGEQPTPEYNIYLDGVGVNGYSPTVDIVNENTSSFQIQVNDINGSELTSPIPKLDYITNNYVSNTSLASTLADYSTTAEIASAYLKVDGSNAQQNIIINRAKITSLSNNSGVRITNNNGRGVLQLSPNATYLQTGSYGLVADYDSGLVSLGNVNGTAKVIQATADKVYYEAYSSNPSDPDNEIATIGDIPTVGNGTITLTQGGVTKGTFTTNQSGNATIDLDAGGGSITNPLVINSDNGLKNLSIGYNSDNELTILSTWLYNGTVPIPMPAYLIGGTNNPISLSNTSTNHGLKTINLNYDSDTLDLNASNKLTVKGMVGADGTNAGSAGLVPAPTATDNTKFLRGDGTWQTVGGGGGSYTEGLGIDITNNAISIDTSVVAQLSDIPDVSGFVTTSDLSTTLASYVQSSSLAAVATTGNYIDLNGRPNLNAYVTLDTTQTISGTKTFNNNIKLNGAKYLQYTNGNQTVNLIGTNSSTVGSDYIWVGNGFDYLMLHGKGTRPQYITGAGTAKDIALYSDIPNLTGYATETWVSNQGYLTSSDISDMATQTWVGQQGYITGITSSDVTSALGYTPYNATNPNGFISSIDSTMVVNALGYTPYNSSNPNGYTSNVGTVTSVNNTQPDANGNVVINLTPTVIDGGNA